MKTIKYVTPEEAEAAFYSAFEHADVAEMMRVWAEHDHIICIHPGSSRLCGREQVKESWRGLFSQGVRVQFKLSHARCTQSPMLAIHVLQENIYVGIDKQPQTPILTTNAYQLTDAGWRMILHHASPVFANARPRELGRIPVLH
jgi:hypothetical protein